MHTPSASDKPEPTPGPWRVSEKTNALPYSWGSVVAGDVVVAYLASHEANAAHIVRCVNAHESLVQALELCVRELQKHENPQNYASSVQLDALEALAKVKATA